MTSAIEDLMHAIFMCYSISMKTFRHQQLKSYGFFNARHAYTLVIDTYLITSRMREKVVTIYPSAGLKDLAPN